MRYKLLAKYCHGYTLDIGCGQQGLKKYLNRESKYFGCDIEGGDIRCSAYSLPYKGRKFKTVLLCEILEHLEMPSQAISEASRVATNRIIITVPNCYSLVRFSRLILGREVEIEKEHILSFNSGNLTQLLSKYNFSPKESFCFPLRLQMFPEIPIKSRFGYWLFMVFDKNK